MGCHTWASYKSNRTIEEARNIWIAKREKWLVDYQVYIDDPMKKPFVDISIEDKLYNISIWKRQLRMIKKRLCTVAMLNDQPEHSYYLPEKGLYIVCKNYHDMFRVRGYPNDQLFSYQECLDFIANYEKVNNTIIEVQDSLKRFWDEYPDGYIHFG